MKNPRIDDALAQKRWLWHAAFWVVYGLTRAVPYYYTIRFYDRRWLEYMLLVEVGFVGLVYLTLAFFRRVSRPVFFVGGLGLWLFFVAAIIALQRFWLRGDPSVTENSFFDLFLGRVTSYLITFVLLVLAKFFKDSFLRERREQAQKSLQIASELELLKGQIAPHFLFNTLNNFYGLAVERSPRLPELMVRLSALLRYSLYETKNATVPLESEIERLGDYIELEKIRLEDGLKIEFRTEINGNEKAQIAPLILIVFVENAFKHAKNAPLEPLEIFISARLDGSKKLFFEVRNSCADDGSAGIWTKKGLGLENVCRRLEAIYPDQKHVLKMEKTGGVFVVSLKIEL